MPPDGHDHTVPVGMMAQWRKAEAGGRPFPKPDAPTENFAVQPDTLDFWGIRVETHEAQTAKFPMERGIVTLSVETTPDGQTKSTRSQPEPAKYRIFNLSPSTPCEQVIDLGKLSDFCKPGEYRVQIICSSGSHRRRSRWQ